MSFPDPKPNQHLRLTLAEAIKRYHDGLITASGLLYCAVKIYRVNGQKLRINNVKEFAAKLEINPRTFYKAKAHLIEKGLIEEDISGTVEIWIPLTEEKVSPNGHASAQSGALNAQSGALNAQSGALNAQSGATTPLEVNDDKGSSTSSNNYQIFISSLSDSERECFEKFVREEWKKETSRLGQPGKEVVSLERFLAKETDFKNWHQRFLASPTGRAAKTEVIAARYDWENDPRFEEWLRRAFDEDIVWAQENEAEREERNAFLEWAQLTDAYIGRLY